MTKICIITHSYPRFEGDWRSNFIESLAWAYARNGAEVTVFVPFSAMFKREPVDPHGVRIVTYRYMPFRFMHTVGYGHSMKSDLRMNPVDLLLIPFLLFFGILRLALLLRREKFDMLHAHWAVPNTITALCARALSFSRARIFTSFPGSDVTVVTRLGWAGRILARLIGKSDYLSCNSSDLREDMVRAGVGKEIDYVIYGVDGKKISFSGVERRRVRDSLKIPGDTTLLLMIGRFVPKKGFSTGFRALKYITSRRQDVGMAVVGDGPLKDEYLEILRRDGTESFVHFIGEIPTGRLSSYYSASDIFVMPSRRLPSDGLNVVVPEAMACGRPIVASGVGGNDLVVFPGVNGFLHDEDDPEQLAELVLRLMESPELVRKMGEQSLRLVQERFNWDAIARYYLGRLDAAGGREGGA